MSEAGEVAEPAHAELVTGALNAFRRILQALRLASMEVQNMGNLSAAQLFVLHQLADGSALSINQLAELTMTDRSSVAEVVDRLAERRWVKREWAAQDRRRAVVTITAAGRQALQGAPAPPTEWLVNAIERLPEAELKALATGLDRLTTELGIRHRKPVMMFDGDEGAPKPRRPAKAPK